jgi:ribonuclease HII
MGRLIVPFAVTHGPTATVDRVNVSQAANRAALRAFQAVAARLPHDTSPRRVYLDGGLYLGTRGGAAPRHVVARTVVCGDERFTVVAAASIVAKVRRDRLMRRLAGRHPGYGFEVHKGYGTPQHLRALRRFGPSPSHRLTFLGFLKDFKRLRRNLSRKH